MSSLSPIPLDKMINWTGIASIVLFYILILAVGMWAARKNTGGGDQEVSERLIGERKNLGVGKQKKRVQSGSGGKSLGIPRTEGG